MCAGEREREGQRERERERGEVLFNIDLKLSVAERKNFKLLFSAGLLWSLRFRFYIFVQWG